MASDLVYDAVRAFMDSSWVEGPVQWENEKFTPPAAGWIAVEMSGNLYAQMSMGAENQADNRWDEDGVLWGHVFVPTGTGSSNCRRIAKAFADLFRGARLIDDDLEFLDAQIGMGDVGDEQGKAFYRISVAIDWRRMEA